MLNSSYGFSIMIEFFRQEKILNFTRIGMEFTRIYFVQFKCDNRFSMMIIKIEKYFIHKIC